MTIIQHMFLAFMVLGGRADAFLRAALPPRCSSALSAGGGGEEGLSRAEAIQRAAAVSGIVLLGAEATLAEAGAEMKDEVEQFAELRGQVEKKGRDEVAKENLTLLTEATSGLKTLDSFIGDKDYKALRLALRNPPIGNLRSSARKVIINIDDKDAEEKATKAYKALITSVDKLDSIANRGMKEKEGLKDDKEIREVYGSCVERGSDLLTLLPKIL